MAMPNWAASERLPLVNSLGTCVVTVAPARCSRRSGHAHAAMERSPPDSFTTRRAKRSPRTSCRNAAAAAVVSVTFLIKYAMRSTNVVEPKLGGMPFMAASARHLGRTWLAPLCLPPGPLPLPFGLSGGSSVVGEAVACSSGGGERAGGGGGGGDDFEKSCPIESATKTERRAESRSFIGRRVSLRVWRRDRAGRGLGRDLAK